MAEMMFTEAQLRECVKQATDVAIASATAHMGESMEGLLLRAIASERERCARICEARAEKHRLMKQPLLDAAEEIRA